ncbi:hypothetical protein OIV83_003919 [Microbotryomycetes sp. JL201]|nr:hypothetical protein OIV83_003919 [Microbotryomycetes sp. JL201]
MSQPHTVLVYGTVELLKGATQDTVKAMVSLVEPEFTFGRLLTRLPPYSAQIVNERLCALTRDRIKAARPDHSHARATLCGKSPDDSISPTLLKSSAMQATLTVLGVNGVAFGSKTLPKGSSVSLTTGDQFSICERRFRWSAASHVPFTLDSPAPASTNKATEPNTLLSSNVVGDTDTGYEQETVQQDEDVISWSSDKPAAPAFGLQLPTTPTLLNKPRMVRPPISAVQQRAPAIQCRRASLRLTITPGRLISQLAPYGEPKAPSLERESPTIAAPASPRSLSSRRVSELLLSPSDSFHRSPSAGDLNELSEDSSSDEEDASPSHVSTATPLPPSRSGLQRSLSLREKLLIKSAQKVACRQSSPIKSVRDSPDEGAPVTAPEPEQTFDANAQSNHRLAIEPESHKLPMPNDLVPVSPRRVPLPETPMGALDGWNSPAQTPAKASSPLMPRSALRKSTPTPVRRKSFFGFFTTPPSTLRRKVSFNEQVFIKEFVTVRQGSVSPPAPEPEPDHSHNLQQSTPIKHSAQLIDAESLLEPSSPDIKSISTPRRARRLSGGTPNSANRSEACPHRSARRIEQDDPNPSSCILPGTPTHQQERKSLNPPATESRIDSTVALMHRMEAIRRRSLPVVLPSPIQPAFAAQSTKQNVAVAGETSPNTVKSPVAATFSARILSPSTLPQTPARSASPALAARTTPNMSSGLRMLFRQQHAPKTPQYIGVRSLFRLEDPRLAQSPCFDGVKDLLTSPKDESTQAAQNLHIVARYGGEPEDGQMPVDEPASTSNEVMIAKVDVAGPSYETEGQVEAGKADEAEAALQQDEAATETIKAATMSDEKASRTRKATARARPTKLTSSLPKRSTRSRIPVVVHDDDDAVVNPTVTVTEPAAVQSKITRAGPRTTRTRKTESEITEFSVSEKPIVTTRTSRSVKPSKVVSTADVGDAENVAPTASSAITSTRATRAKRGATTKATASEPVVPVAATGRTLRARR